MLKVDVVVMDVWMIGMRMLSDGFEECFEKE